MLPIGSKLKLHNMPENNNPPTLQIRSTYDLGAAIVAQRKGRGYSQQEFADLAGVGRRFVSELESGKPTAEIGKTLQVLTALGIDVELRIR